MNLSRSLKVANFDDTESANNQQAAISNQVYGYDYSLHKPGRSVCEMNISAEGSKFINQDRYIKDGKMHFISEIREILFTSEQGSGTKGCKLFSSYTYGEDQMFKMMTLKERDMVLFRTVDGTEWKVHKKMIAEESSIFKEMIAKDPKFEDSCQIIDILRYSGKTIEELMRFILLGKISIISNDFSLYDAAKEYKIYDLKQYCLESMKYRLNLKTVIEILQFIVVNDETESELYETCCWVVFR